MVKKDVYITDFRNLVLIVRDWRRPVFR